MEHGLQQKLKDREENDPDSARSKRNEGLWNRVSTDRYNGLPRVALMKRKIPAGA